MFSATSTGTPFFIRAGISCFNAWMAFYPVQGPNRTTFKIQSAVLARWPREPQRPGIWPASFFRIGGLHAIDNRGCTDATANAKTPLPMPPPSPARRHRPCLNLHRRLCPCQCHCRFPARWKVAWNAQRIPVVRDVDIGKRVQLGHNHWGSTASTGSKFTILGAGAVSSVRRPRKLAWTQNHLATVLRHHRPTCQAWWRFKVNRLGSSNSTGLRGFRNCFEPHGHKRLENQPTGHHGKRERA
jgi:hypothetical protein